MSKSEDHRVQLVADSRLVEQTNAVAEIQDMSRTDLIKRAIHMYLTKKREDNQFRRQAQEAFIDERIDEETFRQALGTEELVKAKQLQSTFETFGEGVPDPEDAPPIPSDEEFYGKQAETAVIEVEGDSKVIDVEEGSQVVLRTIEPSEEDTDDDQETVSSAS